METENRRRGKSAWQLLRVHLTPAKEIGVHMTRKDLERTFHLCSMSSCSERVLHFLHRPQTPHSLDGRKQRTSLRWRLHMQEFVFAIDDIKGETNIVADASSRLCRERPAKEPSSLHALTASNMRRLISLDLQDQSSSRTRPQSLMGSSWGLLPCGTQIRVRC